MEAEPVRILHGKGIKPCSEELEGKIENVMQAGLRLPVPSRLPVFPPQVGGLLGNLFAGKPQARQWVTGRFSLVVDVCCFGVLLKQTLAAFHYVAVVRHYCRLFALGWYRLGSRGSGV